MLKWCPEKWKIALSRFPRRSIHLFICSFIYFPRVDIGSHPLSEACRKSNAQRLSAESGRGVEDQSMVGSGRGTFAWITPARLGSGGAHTEGRRKRWHLRVCLQKGGWLESSCLPNMLTLSSLTWTESCLHLTISDVLFFWFITLRQAPLKPRVCRKINVHNASCFCNDLAPRKRSLWI